MYNIVFILAVCKQLNEFVKSFYEYYQGGHNSPQAQELLAIAKKKAAEALADITTDREKLDKLAEKYLRKGRKKISQSLIEDLTAFSSTTTVKSVQRIQSCIEQLEQIEQELKKEERPFVEKLDSLLEDLRVALRENYRLRQRGVLKATLDKRAENVALLTIAMSAVGELLNEPSYKFYRDRVEKLPESKAKVAYLLAATGAFSKLKKKLEDFAWQTEIMKLIYSVIAEILPLDHLEYFSKPMKKAENSPLQGSNGKASESTLDSKPISMSATPVSPVSPIAETVTPPNEGMGPANNALPDWIPRLFRAKQFTLLKNLYGKGFVTESNLCNALGFLNPLTREESLGRRVRETNKNLCEREKEIGELFTIRQRTPESIKSYFLDRQK